MRRAVAIIALTVVFAITAAAYAELAKRALHSELAYTYHGDNVYLSDFVQFYTAGKMVSTGQGKLVYDAVAINKNMPIALPQDDRILLAMPFFISFMAPLALLPVHAGFICWILLSLAALVVASHSILKGRRHLGKPMIAMVIFFILASLPAWFTLFVGHACFFQYLFIAVFFWALFSNRDLPAAAALALASFKPQFAIPLLVPALAQKRFKLLAFAFLFEGLLIGLSVLTLGTQATFNGPLLVLNWEHLHTEFIPRMICLRALLDVVFDHKTAVAIAWSLFAFWIGFTFELWRRAKTAELMRTAAAITICGGIVFSPHAHVYDAVLMGLAACFLWPRNGIGAFSRSAGFVKLSLWSLLAAYPLLSWYFFIFVGTGDGLSGYPFAWLNLAIMTLMMLLFREQLTALAEEVQHKAEASVPWCVFSR